MGLRGGRQADPLTRTFLQAKPLVLEGTNTNFTHLVPPPCQCSGRLNTSSEYRLM